MSSHKSLSLSKITRQRQFSAESKGRKARMINGATKRTISEITRQQRFDVESKATKPIMNKAMKRIVRTTLESKTKKKQKHAHNTGANSTKQDQFMISFQSPQELSQWLHENHASKNELLIKMFKVKSGIPSVTWNEVVMESLCWGWIDGLKKKIDEHTYLQRITPRKSRSIWSKRNTEHVARLIAEGRMKEPGLAQVHAAKADGRWEKAYKISEMKVPIDFIEELNQLPKAKSFYSKLTKADLYVIAYQLSSAKTPKTRQQRFMKYISKLNNNEKP